MATTTKRTEARADVPLVAPRRSSLMPTVAFAIVLALLAGVVALLVDHPRAGGG